MERGGVEEFVGFAIAGSCRQKRIQLDDARQRAQCVPSECAVETRYGGTVCRLQSRVGY